MENDDKIHAVSKSELIEQLETKLNLLEMERAGPLQMLEDLARSCFVLTILEHGMQKQIKRRGNTRWRRR